MYATHARAIQAWAQGGTDPARLVAVGGFVLCTIRVPLRRAVAETRALLERGDASPLFGWKERGLDTLADRAPELSALIQCGAGRDTLLAEFSRIPGLGLAKAGFVLQLACGVSGCLDTHNLRRFGLRAAAFSVPDGCTDRLRYAKAAAYHAAIDAAGGTASLWDSWCRYVAEAQPHRYRDAWEVSALHCEALGVNAGLPALAAAAR